MKLESQTENIWLQIDVSDKENDSLLKDSESLDLLLIRLSSFNSGAACSFKQLIIKIKIKHTII